MLGTEAMVKYLAGTYEILDYGEYVFCAVTAEKIPLEDLTYWNVARQEAYKDCYIAFEQEYKLNPSLGASKERWL